MREFSPLWAANAKEWHPIGRLEIADGGAFREELRGGRAPKSSCAQRSGTDDPGPAPGLHTSEPQQRDHLGLRSGDAAPRSERLLDGIEHRIDIEARVAVCQEALQPLINQLPIGIAELRVALLGSDRVPQGLDQLQALRQGQGQQVISTVAARLGGTPLAAGRKWRLPRWMGPLVAIDFLSWSGASRPAAQLRRLAA